MKRIEASRILFKQYEKQQQIQKQPAMLYEPVNYMMSIGGKKIRPLLVLAGYELYKPDAEAALPAAYAVELFHAFTLVHDDIMDEADMRRGQATVHKKYTTSTAILSGDVMQIIALEYLLKLPPSVDTAAIYATFLQTARGICEGQQMDIDFEKRQQVSVQEYLTMIELKTAILLGLALQLGALAAGQPKDAVDSLYQLGVDLGLAFQIKDDLLDTFGNANIGKKIGGDILRAKKTYLVAKTLELANDTDQQLLIDTLHDTTIEDAAKIEKVLQLFDKYNIQTEVQNILKQYEQRIINKMQNITDASLLSEIVEILRLRTM